MSRNVGGAYGADPAQLQAFALLLRNRADELQATVTSFQQKVTSIDWFGPDADAYRDDFSQFRSQQLVQLFTEIEGAAAILDRNREEQVSASSIAGAGLGAGLSADVGAVVDAAGSKATPRTASPSEIEAVLKNFDNRVAATKKWSPALASRLSSWGDEMRTGEHSLAEVKAFEKFQQSIVLAAVLRAPIGSAATEGFAFLESASDAAKSSAGGIISIFSPAKETGYGEAFADGVVTGVRDEFSSTINGAIADKSVSAITKVYAIRAEQFLLNQEQAFRASANESSVDASMVRRNAVDAMNGYLEVADAQSQTGSAFDLGPSWATSALSEGMDFLVPKSGTATFAVLDGAKASQDALAAARYFNLAVDGGFQQLVRGVEGMRL